jgi:hypothetical protein
MLPTRSDESDSKSSRFRAVSGNFESGKVCGNFVSGNIWIIKRKLSCKRLSVKNPNQFVSVSFFKFISIKFNRQTGSKCRIISQRGLKLYFILTIAGSGCVVNVSRIRMPEKQWIWILRNRRNRETGVVGGHPPTFSVDKKIPDKIGPACLRGITSVLSFPLPHF